MTQRGATSGRPADRYKNWQPSVTDKVRAYFPDTGDGHPLLHKLLVDLDIYTTGALGDNT
jgi:hypothetical protein